MNTSITTTLTIACVLASSSFAACDKEATSKPAQHSETPANAAAPTKRQVLPTNQPEAQQPVTIAEVGKPAPDFTLPDLDGNQVALSGFKGKTVVLEWFNPECPFVRYAHGEGPLADMATRHGQGGIVWLAINSSAPGKQGHGIEKNKKAADDWSMGHPILVDENGGVGRQYQAKTTPHMFVIDPQGTLVYAGALDNAPRGNVDGGERSIYVDQALAALAASKPVGMPETKPYGCSVKYVGS